MRAPSFDKLSDGSGLRPSDILVREERVERWEQLNAVPERKAGCLKTAAPLARKHPLDEDVVGAELRTNLARLLTPFARQVALGRTIPEPKLGRVARSRSVRVPQHRDSAAVSKSLPRQLRRESRLGPTAADQN